MMRNIKHLAVVGAVTLANASGALAIETGGVKLPTSVAGGFDNFGIGTSVSVANPGSVEETQDFLLPADSFGSPAPMEPDVEMTGSGVDTDTPDQGAAGQNDLLGYDFGNNTYSGFDPSGLGTPNGPDTGPPVLKNGLEFSGWNGHCWVWEGVCY